MPEPTRAAVPADFTGTTFEAVVKHHLLGMPGYAQADPADFDNEQSLDPTVFIPFVKEKHPEVSESPENLHGADTETVLLDDLAKAMDSRRSLTVIRHGFKCFGKLIRVAFFAPAHRINPDTEPSAPLPDPDSRSTAR